jgi:hypothetical protein
MLVPGCGAGGTAGRNRLLASSSTDWPLYERQFLALMRSRHIENTSRELLAGACLLCSEETPHHRLRRLVAEIPQTALAEIDHIP